MVFMIFALTRTFHLFRASSLLPDAVRMVGAVVLILAAGVTASYLPLPRGSEGRLPALLKLVEIFFACALVAWPLAIRTGAITAADRASLINALFPSRKQNPACAQAASSLS